MAHKSRERENMAKRANGAPQDAGAASACPDRQAAAQALEGAWLRAVAIVWSDPAKMDQLKREPRQFLHAHCGYDAPANVELAVHEAQASGGSWHWAVRSPLEAEVVLEIPPPPELSEQPVALAELANVFAAIPLCAC
jgi:ribosomally synthesized peptide (two-chain TOMM family)